MSLSTQFSNIKIDSVYTCVPSKEVTNSFFSEHFSNDQIDKTIKMIGVQRRYWTNNTTTSLDLCVECGRKMLFDLDIRSEIDALIFITQTPDLQMPASAFLAHDLLGLKDDCAVFDVNLGCSGYVYGLWLASSLINSGLKKVLLMAGETPSKIVNLQDPATAFLFGDAGSATLVSKSQSPKISNYLVNSRGVGSGSITIPNGLKGNILSNNETINDPSKLFMDGAAVFNFTIAEIPKIIHEMSSFADIQIQDWDYVLLHQANRFMLDHIYKKAKVPKNSQIINIEKFGNTSSVSIPLLITDSRYSVNNNRILLVGFGVGLSWAAVDLEHKSDLKTHHFTYEQ